MASFEKAARHSRSKTEKRRPLRGGATAITLPDLRGERGSGNESVETLRVRGGAIRQRLERLAGELHQRLGELRGLGDRAVEGLAREVALQLQILGRRLGFGERTDRVGGLLDAITAGRHDVLADRARAFAGHTAGLD